MNTYVIGVSAPSHDLRERVVVGAVSGVAAGVIFAMASMIYAHIEGPGVWAPPHMIATILGFEMAPTFSAAPVLAGLMMHMVLSAMYGAAFTLVLAPLRTLALLAAGTAYGLVLYAVNFHGFAEFEHFAVFRMMAGNTFEILVHVMFGVLLAIGWIWWRRGNTLPA